MGNRKAKAKTSRRRTRGVVVWLFDTSKVGWEVVVLGRGKDACRSVLDVVFGSGVRPQALMPALLLQIYRPTLPQDKDEEARSQDPPPHLSGQLRGTLSKLLDTRQSRLSGRQETTRHGNLHCCNSMPGPNNFPPDAALDNLRTSCLRQHLTQAKVPAMRGNCPHYTQPIDLTCHRLWPNPHKFIVNIKITSLPVRRAPPVTKRTMLPASYPLHLAIPDT